MPCYSPIEAWQEHNGIIKFSEPRDFARFLKLACGRCIGCKLERSKQWAARCMHEAQMHSNNCFVTLTYDAKHLPSQNQLIYGDFQAFMRRVRKRFGKVRFYMCGEYGEECGRPHFHACLFGLDFSEDRIYFRTLPSGSKIYRSATLENLWTFGFSSIGDVTFESAAYIARYICKKIVGEMADSHYKRVDLSTGEVYDLTPEFSRMSLKPGIGSTWYDKFHGEVFPHDRIVVRGMEVQVPKYYRNKLRKADPILSETLSFDRCQRFDAADSTRERLEVREKVAVARLSFKKRGLRS